MPGAGEVLRLAVRTSRREARPRLLQRDDPRDAARLHGGGGRAGGAARVQDLRHQRGRRHQLPRVHDGVHDPDGGRAQDRAREDVPHIRRGQLGHDN